MAADDPAQDKGCREVEQREDQHDGCRQAGPARQLPRTGHTAARDDKQDDAQRGQGHRQRSVPVHAVVEFLGFEPGLTGQCVAAFLGLIFLEFGYESGGSVPVLSGDHLIEVVHAAAHEQPLAVVDVVRDIERTVAVPLEPTLMVERKKFYHGAGGYHIGDLVALVGFS